ncbi:MAG: GtrA family protein [Nitrosomonadales bacterium]|nr:GtrA family protein [Nitrosomonadales bacterium]
MIDRFCRFVAEIVGCNRFARDTNFSLCRNRFIRFLVAGGVNTLFGFAVYSAFIIADMPVWFSLLAGTILGTIFNFITTGGYVFRELSLPRVPRFIICYLLIYGINFMLIELISIWLSNKILSQAILIFPVAMLSYFLMARFVFSTKRCSP